MRRPSTLIVTALLAVTLAPGCTGKYKSDFSLIVTNRAVNAILVSANGSELGQIASGQSGTFTLNLAESNSNIFTGGVAPTPQSQVTLSARDLRTGTISTNKTVTMSGSSPTYLTFAASDFPATVPTVARFTASPTTPGVNQDVSFNASASTPNTGTFTWTFGDGTTGTGAVTSHRYAQPGSYVVTLTVTSESGQSSTASNTVTVSTTLPGNAANFTISPASPGVNQDVYFNASTSNVTNGTYAWDFGDGTTGSNVTITHRFARAGTYAITLRVSNTSGQSASASRSLTVSATSSQVVASFVFSPAAPGVDQTVFFNAAASMPQNGTYAWNFGDGRTGTGLVPTHAYSGAGTYTVTLTVTNDVGQAATTTRTVTVSATSAQVVASFVFSPTTPGIDQEVFFNASASRPADGRFSWNFGDGSSGSGVGPIHRYGQAGTYTVTLIVSNDVGQSATTSRTITVSAVSSQVVASFVFSPTAPGIDQEVFFNASASRPSDGTFSWNFGDGDAGSGMMPTHRYSAAGTYAVTLVVGNDLGQSATTSRTITVSATSSQVVASFVFSPVSPGIGQDVFLNAAGSRPTDGTFSWNFGDGTVGTGVTPTHRYSQAATYTVSLTVGNASGQVATTSQTITVSATSGALAADFTFSPTDPSLSRGTSTVIFDATSSSAGVTAWTWDFGDGKTSSGSQSTTNTFARAGTWVVRLTVADATGRTATITKNVVVAP